MITFTEEELREFLEDYIGQQEDRKEEQYKISNFTFYDNDTFRIWIDNPSCGSGVSIRAIVKLLWCQVWHNLKTARLSLTFKI